jgi:hypothetical protein
MKRFQWKGCWFTDPHSEPGLSQSEIDQIHLRNVQICFGDALEYASPKRISKVSAKLRRRYGIIKKTKKLLMT